MYKWFNQSFLIEVNVGSRSTVPIFFSLIICLLSLTAYTRRPIGMYINDGVSSEYIINTYYGNRLEKNI